MDDIVTANELALAHRRRLRAPYAAYRDTGVAWIVRGATAVRLAIECKALSVTNPLIVTTTPRPREEAFTASSCRATARAR